MESGKYVYYKMLVKNPPAREHQDPPQAPCPCVYHIGIHTYILSNNNQVKNPRASIKIHLKGKAGDPDLVVGIRNV